MGFQSPRGWSCWRARGTPRLREVANTPRALRANSLDSRARYGHSPPPPPPPPAGLRPRCLGKAGRSPAGARDAHLPHVPSLGPGTRPFSSETQGPSFTTLWKMVEGPSVRRAWLGPCEPLSPRSTRPLATLGPFRSPSLNTPAHPRGPARGDGQYLRPEVPPPSRAVPQHLERAPPPSEGCHLVTCPGFPAPKSRACARVGGHEGVVPLVCAVEWRLWDVGKCNRPGGKAGTGG